MGWLADRLDGLIQELRERVELLASEIPDDRQAEFKGVLDAFSNIERDFKKLSDPNLDTSSLIAPLKTSIGWFYRRLQWLTYGSENQKLIEIFNFPFRTLNAGLSEISNKNDSQWFYDIDADEAPDISPILISYLLQHLPQSSSSSRVNVKIISPDEHPSVLYHPRYTPKLLRQLIEAFSHERGTDNDIFLILTAEQHVLALSMTQRRLPMTPEMWNTFFINRDGHLREFGGSIEPLTWDEGYGQGVIVRLPWADTEKM